MRKFLALFVTMGMLLSACGSKSDAQKVYNFGLETDIVTMDSAFATDPASMSALHATTEGLMGVDAKGKTVPMLAKSYSLNDDHTVYTFKLRDNLKWTDLSGKTYPLEAQDFGLFMAACFKECERICLYVYKRWCINQKC